MAEKGNGPPMIHPLDFKVLDAPALLWWLKSFARRYDMKIGNYLESGLKAMSWTDPGVSPLYSEYKWWTVE